MPYNHIRQTMKNGQRAVEHTSASVLKELTKAQKTATKSSPDKTLADLDTMIAKFQTLKRKLTVLHDDEVKHTRASKARIEHLAALYNSQSLEDVKYEDWSRMRLSRLLVDYMLRCGYVESAKALATSQGIEELVDVDAFVAAHRVERSLREGHDTALALAWCAQNSQALKKVGGGLEFELRLQQFIELVREGHERSRDSSGSLDGDAYMEEIGRAHV